MFLPCQNWTARSANDLLADLKVCRQLRHSSAQDFDDVVTDIFAARGKRLFIWEQDAFEMAFLRFGYSCDICGANIRIEPDLARKAAERALENLDGFLKLMLCRNCSSRYRVFVQREFEREVRALYSPDMEKMQLAFLASEVSLAYNRYTRGEFGEQAKTGNRRPNYSAS